MYVKDGVSIKWYFKLITNKQEYRQDPLNALICYPTWRNLKRGHLSLGDQNCNFSAQWMCGGGNFKLHLRTERIYILAGQTLTVALKSYRGDISQSSPYVLGPILPVASPQSFCPLRWQKRLLRTAEMRFHLESLLLLVYLCSQHGQCPILSGGKAHSSVCSALLISRSPEQHGLWSLVHRQLPPLHAISPRSLQLAEGTVYEAVGIDGLLVQGDSCFVSSWQCCYLNPRSGHRDPTTQLMRLGLPSSVYPHNIS